MRAKSIFGFVIVIGTFCLNLPSALAQPTLNSLADNFPGLSPSVVQVGSAAFPLTLKGTGFTPTSIARADLTSLTTTFIDAATLSAVVPDTLLQTPASLGISVIDSGATSNTIALTVTYRGDANGNRRVNISDALVIALSVGGLLRPPVPLSLGDLNLNDVTNIGDAVVAALFTGEMKANLDTPAINSATVSGDSLTLVGTGFSSIAENNIVFLSKSGGGFIAVPAVSVAAGQGTKTLTIAIPSGVQSGPVFVERPDLSLPGQPFVIAIQGTPMPLYLSKVTPNIGLVAGATVTLTGGGFDPIAANNSVAFSAAGDVVSVAPTSASATSMIVRVPAGATSGFISVTTAGITSNRKSMFVSSTATPLQINNVYYADSPGQPILIEGLGFNRADPGDNQVLFTDAGHNDVSAAVVSAGLTELIAVVPASAVNGNLRIRTSAGSNTSNSWSYNVARSNRTQVSGTLTGNTTWTAAQSPIVLTGNTIVAAGATLTIQAGVTVLVQNLKGLQIDGQLIARGTSASPILFTADSVSPAPGKWGSIRFTNSSVDATFDGNGNYTGGSILDGVTIEYAGGGDDAPGAVTIENAAPFITNCIIRNNRAGGIRASNPDSNITLRVTNNLITANATSDSVIGNGIRASGNLILNRNTVTNHAGPIGGGLSLGSYAGSVIVVSGNTIRGNQVTSGGGSGISIGGQGTFTITDNSILDNGPSNYSGGGILMIGGNAAITNNVITGNKSIGGYNEGGGIAIGSAYIGFPGDLHSVTVSRNIIANNVSGGPGGGIVVYTSAAITNNTFVGNSASQGSGIKTGRGAPVIQNNTFSSHSGQSTVAVADTPAIEQNNFVNNATAFDVYNTNSSGSPAIDATSNWWGTVSAATVQARVFDNADDNSRGVVNVSPLLNTFNVSAPISPPQNLSVTAPGAGSVTATWTANAEPDLAGYRIYYSASPGPPFAGTGAAQGPSPIDAGNNTGFSLSGLSPGTYYITVTAYDSSRDGSNDQTDGNESWYAPTVIVNVP